MAPPSADIDVLPSSLPDTIPTKNSSASRLTGPLSYSGSLDAYKQIDLTSVIGREFSDLQLSEILQDDTKIRDLAVLGKSLSSVDCNHAFNTFSSVTTRGCFLP